MRRLMVPIQSVSQLETIFDKINLIRKAGAEARIDQVNWKDDFPKSLPVTVQVAHDGEILYLYYRVIGEVVRAANSEDFGSVWEDSCVEFFMQREGENLYRNIECNILGAVLTCKQESKGNCIPQSDLVKSIYRYSTINHRYEDEKEVSDWSLYLEIPKAAIGFAENESLSGQKIRANFYKCGDKTAEPHFLSWNPIDMPKPNFHVPQFFGLIKFE